jgi:hypothetical protein
MQIYLSLLVNHCCRQGKVDLSRHLDLSHIAELQWHFLKSQYGLSDPYSHSIIKNFLQNLTKQYFERFEYFLSIIYCLSVILWSFLQNLSILNTKFRDQVLHKLSFFNFSRCSMKFLKLLLKTAFDLISVFKSKVFCLLFRRLFEYLDFYPQFKAGNY